MALVSWLPVAAAQQATASAYGQRYVANQDARLLELVERHVAGSPLVKAPLPAPDPAMSATLRQVMQDMQLADGPYAPGLAELSLDLGQYLLAEGDYPAAVAALSQALHVGRINDGLRTERQVPALRLLLQAHEAAGDFAALDTRYAYLLHLYRPAARAGDREAVAALLDYLRWQRRAAVLDVEAGSMRRALDGYELGKALVEQALAESAGEDPELVTAAVLEHLAALHVVNQVSVPGVIVIDNRPPMGRMAPIRHDPYARELTAEEQRLLRLQSGIDGEVRRLLESAAADLAGAPEQRLRLLLAHADWQQWKGRLRAAEGIYLDVIAELTAMGRDDLIESWFGAPLELPEPRVFGAGLGERYGDSTPFRARFDVSARGQVRNLSLEPLTDMEGRRQLPLAREIRTTRFRPRAEAGKLAATTGLEREYTYYHN